MRPEDLIIPELAPGEQPRWVGAPSVRATVAQNALALVFGLFFLIAPWLSTPGGMLAVTFSSLLGSVCVYRALIEIVSARRTAYAITDRRILMVRRFLGLRVRNWLPDSINLTEKKVRADGAGSVMFRLEQVNGLDWGGSQKVGFHGVQNVEAAYEALTRLVAGRASA